MTYEEDIKELSGKELIAEKGKVEVEFEKKSFALKYEIGRRVLNMENEK